MPYSHSPIARWLAAAALVIPSSLSAQSSSARSPDVEARCEWKPSCSTPGATLALRETVRDSSGRKVKVTYRLAASGFPPGKVLTLWMRQADEATIPLVTGYTADPSGAIVCADSTAHRELAAGAGRSWCPMPLQEIDFGLGAMSASEAVRFALRGDGDGVAAYGEAIPHPVEASSGSCRLAVVAVPVRGAPFTVFEVRGSGFPAGEKVRLVSSTGRDSADGEATVTSDGSFIGMVLPRTRSRGGRATYQATASSCTVEIAYDWGNQLRQR